MSTMSTLNPDSMPWPFAVIVGGLALVAWWVAGSADRRARRLERRNRA